MRGVGYLSSNQSREELERIKCNHYSAEVWALTVSISTKVHALTGPNSVEVVSPHESLHPLDQVLVLWFIIGVIEGLTHPLDQEHKN